MKWHLTCQAYARQTHQNWWLMGKKNGLNFGPFRLGLQTLTEKTAIVTATL